jgi:hypothetical protein
VLRDVLHQETTYKMLSLCQALLLQADLQQDRGVQEKTQQARVCITEYWTLYLAARSPSNPAAPAPSASAAAGTQEAPSEYVAAFAATVERLHKRIKNAGEQHDVASVIQDLRAIQDQRKRQTQLSSGISANDERGIARVQQDVTTALQEAGAFAGGNGGTGDSLQTGLEGMAVNLNQSISEHFANFTEALIERQDEVISKMQVRPALVHACMHACWHACMLA